MIKLIDYFSPLNFQNIIFFILTLLFFDCLGTFVKKTIFKTKVDNTPVIINWLIGLGTFVSLWFFIGFFIEPKKIPLLVSVVLLSLVSIKTYLKSNQLTKLIKEVWRMNLPLLVILFFLPSALIKASLPPYYSDETAYHFIAPIALNNLHTFWVFEGGMYANLPRLFDTFFILSFSAFHTYSIARLIHFSILMTSILFSFNRLKFLFGQLPALFFITAFFSIPQDIVLISTIGFVDIACIAFMLIAWISAINLVIEKSTTYFWLTIIFWSMALGTKYTALTASFAFFLPLLILLLINKSKHKTIFSLSSLFKISLTSLIFGGYWYVKNLISYGNPFYPFILPCTRFANEWCNTSSKIFGNWTTPINFNNFPKILNEIFIQNQFLIITAICLPLFIFLNKNSKTKIISIWIAISILIEIVILKATSGFYMRYHQHLQLLFLILISLQISNIYSSKILKSISNLIFIIITITLGLNLIKTIEKTNSSLLPQEINYAVGKMDIYDWVRYKFPRVGQAVVWCDSPPSNQPVHLAVFDPDMIWFAEDGSIRTFMTNCGYNNPNLEGLPLNQVLETAKAHKMQFWTITPNHCLPEKSVTKKFDQEGDLELYLRHLNNLIVCNAHEILPNLYYFDYSNIQ
jgi:hypothetical protein